MKGLIVILLFALSLNVSAHSIKAQDLSAIKLVNGELIGQLSLKESIKVLESLDKEANIEIRNRVIYPEEVTELVVRKLTKGRISGKRPNPQDYN